MSTYLKYLPAIYQDQPFLGAFLKAFEKLLSGIDDGVPEGEPAITGIEEQAAGLASYFTPADAPPEFLKWLAGWVALALREDWDVGRQRELIRRVVSLYPIRGTMEGLKKYLGIYLESDRGITISETVEPFQVGVTSRVGVNTVVGEGRPHYFRIDVVLAEPNPVLLGQRRQAITDIVEREKPAHTYYSLVTTVPTMRIDRHSTVGVDTLLGGQL